MDERNVLQKLLEVKDLPTLPGVMGLILEMVEDDESSVQDLSNVIHDDHAISTRILRLANSAFYGLRTPVDSINRAVVVLGFDAIRQLALATSVFDALSDRAQFALDPEDFWLHSLGTAKAAQILANRHCEVASLGGSFTAGLIHDIGKYLLALVLKEEYRDIVDEARASHKALRQVEMEKLGTTHSEVGQWIANKWRFPDTIVTVIGKIYRAGTYHGPHHTEVALIALADHISRQAGFGYAGDEGRTDLSKFVLEALGLQPETVDSIVEELVPKRQETIELYNLLSRT